LGSSSTCKGWNRVNDNPYSVGEQPTLNDTNLQGPEFEGAVRGMQVIAAAMMIGVLSFLLVVILTLAGDTLGLNNPSVMTLVAAGFSTLMIVNYFVVSRFVAKALLKQAVSNDLINKDEPSKQQVLVGIYRTHMIVGLALLEGAAFFNLVALMTSKNVLSWCAVWALLGLMLFRSPTRTRVSFWVQDKLRELQM